MARFTRVFGMRELPVRLVKGLRVRLMLSYVFFFTLLLVGIGLFYRQTLQTQLNDQEGKTLAQQWDAGREYFEFDEQRPVWSPEPDDAEAVAQIKNGVYLIADANGIALDYNQDTYDSIQFTPGEIRDIMAQSKPQVLAPRVNKNGEPFLIQAGRIVDDTRLPRAKQHYYFWAIGRSLAETQDTISKVSHRYFLFLLPLLVALSMLFGWAVAGRAIRPLNSVAQAAQNITGSNLSLQIPLRGAGDELDHLIESFNLMTGRLNQSFEQIRRFSTDVSHELRTPLTAIRGQLEVALFTAETPEQYRDAMVNALEDVEQLSSIVRALLLLSQAESGQLALQKTPLDLGEVALEVVDQFQIPAQEKKIRLTARMAPGSTIHADRTQIERLLANLLSNAVKYTPAGGSVQVRVGPAETPVFVSLEVEDSGVGIPAENLPHIFDRFYRVRNPQTNSIAGLGLGLSFVSWIVQAHEGRIEVASTVGEGTRFRILLPREQEAGHAGAQTVVAVSSVTLESST
jgi:heavy metal sensor kinase